MAFSSTNMNRHFDLETVEKTIRPFPATATKIMALCNSQESRPTEIAELIECEPAVAVKLLAMANSPLFATTRAVTNIHQAIVMLGYRSVSQMALTIAAGPLFTSGDPALLQHRTSLFRQSLGVATVSRLFAEQISKCDPSEAFLGGMMLDVGKLFFFDMVPEHYVSILNENKAGDTATIESEKFGMDHPTIGNQCAKSWGLPDQIGHLIQNHHASENEDSDGLMQSVLAGIYFAQKWNIGFATEDEHIKNDDIESLIINLNEEELSEVAIEQYKSIESIFFS